MDESNDWTRRVEQMTAASAHEQLRGYIHEAQDAQARMIASAAENNDKLIDAQRELHAELDRKLGVLRDEVFVAIAAVGEELDGEAKRHREHATGALGQMEARLESLERSVAALLDRLDGIEDRAAQRMVDRMATAFAHLREGNGNGHTNGAIGHHDQVTVG